MDNPPFPCWDIHGSSVSEVFVTSLYLDAFRLMLRAFFFNLAVSALNFGVLHIFGVGTFCGNFVAFQAFS